MPRGKAVLRALFALLCVSATATLAAGYATSSGAPSGGSLDEGDDIAPPRRHVTVIATDSNSWLGKGRSGPRARAELFAVGPNGTVTYYNDTHTRYWDVDPVAGTRATVEYLYADHRPPEQCGGDRACTRNGIERVNLSTGEVTQVFSRVTPGKHATRWHDADRIDETHVLVAGIARDRVFVVNTTRDVVTWSWNAQAAFSVERSGGPYPADWTHLNDVEVLGNGTFLASIRNHDQVVFLDRQRGLLRNRTLGADGHHEVLFEQHNPDYIPESSGGPALLVADSENNRVVEYQWTGSVAGNGTGSVAGNGTGNVAGNGTGSEWTRTWTWRDSRLQWPRDADRLPNGHTLVTDSNGDRVLEVDADGDVVWSVPVAFPYEAERLGTGGESAGGPSARRANLTGRSTDTAGVRGAGSTGGPGGESTGDPNSADDPNSAGDSNPIADPNSAGVVSVLWGAIHGLFSGPHANAVMYVLPVWVGPLELAAIGALAGSIPAWLLAELYWSNWLVVVRSPVHIARED